MYFYKNKLSILSLSNECLVPNFQLHDFASLKSIFFFWGRTPRPSPFIVSKRTMVTQAFLIHKSAPPHTHTYVLKPPFASEKSCIKRKYKE